MTTKGQEDRSIESSELSVEDAGEGLLQFLPGDGDEVVDEDDVEIPVNTKRKKKEQDDADEGEPGDEGDDADSLDDADSDDNDAQDDADDDAGDEGDEDAEGDDDELVEVFTVTLPGGKEEDVTAEELVAGYSRTADYTRKTQQVAEKGKALDGELAETQEARQKYLTNLKVLNKSLEEMYPTPDWDAVKRERPETYGAEYADWQRAETKRQALRDEEKRVEEEQQAEIQKRTDKFLAAERVALEKAIPEFADAEKGKVLAAEMAAFAERRFGVSEDQFNKVQNHILLVMLRDSMELEKLKSGTKQLRRKKVKRGKTKVMKPGARPTGSARRKSVRRSKQASERLAQSGSVLDAAAAMLDLED